jgi:hypothetical protein
LATYTRVPAGFTASPRTDSDGTVATTLLLAVSMTLTLLALAG